jgi:hypothetical protein
MVCAVPATLEIILVRPKPTLMSSRFLLIVSFVTLCFGSSITTWPTGVATA